LRPSLGFVARSVLLVAAIALPARVEADGKSDLASPDPALAYAAIEQAAKTKDVSLAAAVFDAGMLSAHAHVAIAAGDALAAMGPEVVKQADLAKALSRASKSKDVKGQRNLARILGAWGDPSVDEMLASLASGRKDPEVQAEALFMAGYVKPTAKDPFSHVVAAVETAFKDRLEASQCAACSAAARLKVPAFADGLLKLARTSTGKSAGLYAVWALSQMGWHGGIGSFLHVLTAGAPKDETRNACLRAITDLSGPDDLADLTALTKSSVVEYRDAACVAIGRLALAGTLHDPAATVKKGEAPPLPAGLLDRLMAIVDQDQAYEVRDSASRALIRIGDRARDAVVAHYPSAIDASEADLALTAIELCGIFRADGAFRGLFKIAQLDKDPTRRMFAARAMGLVNPTLAVEECVAGIQKDRRGRDTTLALVRALGYVRSEPAYLALVGMLGNTEFAPEMLHEAEASLERLTAHRFGRKPDKWAAWYAKAQGKTPFTPHIGRFDRGKNRRETTAKGLYGLTATTEQAVENGLRWLESVQHVEGVWDGNEKGYGGVIGCEPAYTGLNLLAFLGAGYGLREGRYHEVVRRGAEFLAATQFYNGGFPVTGGGDKSWIFAYLIGMAVWGINESYGLSGDEAFRAPAQRGIDYLARVQTPGGGWRYGPRYTQSDTSCTSWVLMTMKTASLLGLDVPQKAMDGIDSWLERCQFDVTGQEEAPDDLATDYDKEVGVKRYFKAFTGYLTLSGKEETALQQTSMTAAGMACRFFMGWKRSHPFMIGSANYLLDFLPQWKRGLEKGQAIAWYFYYWYYGTMAMHQMGGRYWRAWNEKIKTMLPENQRREPPDLAGSWDPDTAVLNGGRLFSTPVAIMTLETYYRFSPLMIEPEGVTTKSEPPPPVPMGSEPPAMDAMEGDEPPPGGAPPEGGAGAGMDK
jgi:hypothetical protein